ncbi:MAG TPA: SAVMC3_10250 family protein [Streptosporangiaceae bacterium]|nr:SAVMC3_10250 family protein [Streptosporangiaceae bacterium]
MARSSSKQSSPFRYYLYLSDIKLNMLFEQIDSKILDQIGAEVKVDLKLASMTLHKTYHPDKARTAKLKVVEQFIDARCEVGTIQRPGHQYFRGNMKMRWGFPASDGLRSDAVCFVGWEPEYPRLICLVGSRHHVLGENPPVVDQSWSLLPTIMEDLAGLNDRSESETRDVIDDIGELPRIFNADGGIFRRLQPQQLQFLAIPLIEEGDGTGYAPHIVLGSPLYVTMAP